VPRPFFDHRRNEEAVHGGQKQVIFRLSNDQPMRVEFSLKKFLVDFINLKTK
tara:strand:+ start:431 stop:586 length:156 start_codon:yes stop_codon:yes gene_type:complete